VPVLVDGTRTITDSWRIAEYLEEAYPDRPALFNDNGGKSHARFLKHWFESTLHPMVSHMIVLDIFNALHEKDKAYFRQTREQRFGISLEAFTADREATRRRFREALAPLRLALADSAFLAGATPAYADYVAFAMFQWARCSSTFALLAEDDPVLLWQERVLGLFDGYARSFATPKPEVRPT
jgi:glutathione S-transferase